jgi:antitoxin component YwqK of YwqJK toxin-antitoxin module
MEKHQGWAISQKLKEYIRTSTSGDAFIIDEIIAVGPGGRKMQLNPIEIIIKIENARSRLNNMLFYYQQNTDAEITFHKFGDTVFCCNSDGSPPEGILRKYSIESGDSVLHYELKYEKKRIVWVKEFYKSKKIKVEYNFGLSDTLGQAVSYYENGNVKAKGNVVADIANISKKYRYEPSDSESATRMLDNFLLLNFAPKGNWKGYYPDGKTAFECNLILKGISVPFENGGSLSDGEAEYSIQDALRFPKTNLHPELSGSCKIYNQHGQLISEENFKN